jgi:predicted dehydrogenase
VPKPELERFINWRLYKEYSCGVLTELASHQIQVANWIYGQIPTQIMASGHVSYWKDGREVPDNIGVVIDYPDGKKFLWDSVISCAHYGLEEEVQGDLGVMELEKGKQFWETPPPAPGILQMINDFEHSIFDNVPLGGASWVPETAANREGEYLIDEKLDTDGSDMQLEAFIRNIQTNTIEPQITIQGYYASLVTLLAFQADETNQIVKFPEKYIIPEKMI